MDNIIIKDNDDIVGYYKDIKEYLKRTIKEGLEVDDYGNIIELCEILTELQEYSESEYLLELSENNGMGLTIKEIKEEL